MPANHDRVQAISHSTSRSGEGARGRRSSELRLLDLDDHSLSEILVRAVPSQLHAGSGWYRFTLSAFTQEEGHRLVNCGSLLRVCRRFRDALLSRATGRWVCNANALLPLALGLRRLEVSRDSERLPWQAVRTGGGPAIAPAALAHLSRVTQLQLRPSGRVAAGLLQDVLALPLLRDLEINAGSVRDGSELHALAALTALTRLRLLRLDTISARPDCLECLSRLRALQSFGAPYASLGSTSVLRFIAALTALSLVDLSGAGFEWSQSGAILAFASEARGLKELRFPFDRVTADDFSSLSLLTQLTALDLSCCMSNLPERDMQRVATLPHLRRLVLTGVGCSRVDIQR